MIIKINKKNPDILELKRVANLIKKGKLVAFPTETVYGLGTNALNPEAIKKIFKAKGRPSDNPLIVHISKIEDLKKLAKNIPKESYILAKKFWPGPITFVLKAKKLVPKETTANLDTVAIRMPNHAIALNLIALSGKFIAAPSANKSGRPSPTDAQTVFEDFGNEIEIIIDGGNCKFGLESTVIDLSTKPFSILRSGAISKEQIESVLKEKIQIANHNKSQPKSPGMKYKHYSPNAKLILLTKSPLDKGGWGIFDQLVKKYKSQNKRIAVLCSNENTKRYKNADLIIAVGSSKNSKQIASNLFRTLRKFDKNNIDIIISESFEEIGIGQAIMERLKKAATKII